MMTINPFVAAFFAPFFIAIGITAWRVTRQDTIDAFEGIIRVSFFRELFVGLGVVFLGGSYMYYLPAYPGPAIFYAVLGVGLILVVAMAYWSASYSLAKR